MSMDAFATGGMVISMAEIKKLNLKSFDNLMNQLVVRDMSIEELAEVAYYEDFEVLLDPKDGLILMEFLTAFTKEFESKYDIEIALRYHNREEIGSSYDGVDGAFFQLYGLFEPTEQYKNLKKDATVDYETWVEFG